MSFAGTGRYVTEGGARSTTKTKGKMSTTKMKGATLRDRIPNTREMGIQDVVRWRCFWRDHLDRKGSDRITRWAKTQKPGIRRPVGRSPIGWYDHWTSTPPEGR